MLNPGCGWIDRAQIDATAVEPTDILVVAPYNAQVSRLAERLASRGVPVGTVDKFQGQEAPVVIYSMATSRPEDAPRGMEFLYSLNRLNVATSRARCAVDPGRVAGAVRAGVPDAEADAAGERACAGIASLPESSAPTDCVTGPVPRTVPIPVSATLGEI